MLIVLVAVLGAVIPTLFYVSFVWWLDRYEKEPVWLLALAFLWGAAPAAILSLILELFLDASILALSGQGMLATLASVSVSAPLVEESAKGGASWGWCSSFLGSLTIYWTASSMVPWSALASP
jgi:RsiW-degrading membrane proteinase PrsW (M82 family)